MKKLAAPLAVLIVLLLVWMFWPDGALDLEKLEKGRCLHGFVTENLYVDAADRAVGARFLSEEKGFIVDLMRIQSVPQGFVWVKTVPDSDRGEPHACEHLLLGKGEKGRYVAALEEMTLGGSSAWTSQLNTVYHFYTLGGEDGFFETLEARLDALVNPDFSDEEMRREVAHIGWVQDESGLHLDEKGTVYTEMVSSFEGPGYPLWGGMGDMLYGKDHPAANASGGHPDSMRAMLPEHMRRFVEKNYHLSNMGIIVSLPEDFSTDRFLKRMEGLLDRVQPGHDRSGLVGMLALDLPPVTGAAPEGAVAIAPYASDNPDDPGELLVAWPPARELDLFERVMLETFLDAFAGGPGTELYELFINSETRRMDTGASGVWAYLSDEPGSPVFVGLDGLDKKHIDPTTLRLLRGLIVEELRKLYDLQPGDPSLQAFNRRAASNLTQREKLLDRALNSPPQFGHRMSGMAGRWQELMAALELEPGFRKSLVMAPQFELADSLLASGGNPWRELLDRWRLLGPEPYAMGVSPDPAVIEANRQSKQARLAASVEDIKRRYCEID